MKINFNKVIIGGNLTRDVELRYTPNGIAVASFGLAINRKFKQGEDTKEEVSYFDVVVFGKQADSCSKHIGKGDSVLIDGRLQQRRWDDNDTGAKRNKVEIVANTVDYLTYKHSGGASGQAPESEPNHTGPEDGGEVPF